MQKPLKEHLYLWCHNAGVYNQGIPGLNEKSCASPVEAAAYLGIDNIIMVSYAGKPTPPFAPVQKEFSHFTRVVWSVIGDSACKYDSPEAYVDEILAMQKIFPNISGGIMDDYFDSGRNFDLETISRKMHTANLPLWVVVYDHQLEQPGVLEKLALCDVITFWTWKIRNIATMEDNLSMLHAKFPDKKIVSGSYLWNFGDEMHLTVKHMCYQCEVALDFLEKGIISDMIILGSPLVGMNLPTVDWTRNWLKENFC